MSLKVLTDWHHPELFESFQLAMHDRLGYEVYRVIGMDWYDKDYWAFEKSWSKDTYAKMFLPLLPTDKLSSDGTYHKRKDTIHPKRTFKMVTVEQALGQKWDIIMSTVPANERGFHRLARLVGARFATQLGNNEHPTHWHLKPLALVSTNHTPPSNARFIRYSQEFDLNLFSPSPVPKRGDVGSFILQWHKPEETLELYHYISDHIPSHDFYIYGWEGQMLETPKDVAREMKNMTAIFHAKAISDGYGYVIHCSAATGRPLIGMASYYKGVRAEYLWKPETSLDLSGLSFEAAAGNVNRLLSDEERLSRMGEAAYANFASRIDFAEDAAKIKELFES